MSVVPRLVGMLPTSWTAAAARVRWRGPRVRRLVDWAAGRLKHRDSVVQTGVGRGLRFNTGPANARLVEHDAALNGFAQVDARRIASDATDGDAAFHAPAESTMGRLASVGPGVGTLVEDTVVPLRRLDTVMRDAPTGRSVPTSSRSTSRAPRPTCSPGPPRRCATRARFCSSTSTTRPSPWTAPSGHSATAEP